MKKDKTKKIFIIKKFEKLDKKAKEKIIFVKFAPERSTSKWTSNKMGNGKKGHKKTDCAKVVTP